MDVIVFFAVVAFAVILFGLNEFRVMRRDKKNAYKFVNTKPDETTTFGKSGQPSTPVVVSEA